MNNHKKIKGLRLGDIVIVPFGRKTEIGVVWDKISNSEKKIKLKHIEKNIKNKIKQKKLIEFINWFSTYNIAPKGMILKMCLGNKKDFKEVKIKKIK